MKSSKLLRGIAIWVPTVLFGLFYVMQGLMKFDPAAGWEKMFANWGYPSPLHLVVGALELAGGLVLFVPRLAAYGAFLLAVIMVGAFGTHLFHAEWINSIATALFVIFLGLLGRARWHRRMTPGTPAVGVDPQARGAE